MADLITFIEQWAAESGVALHDPMRGSMNDPATICGFPIQALAWGIATLSGAVALGLPQWLAGILYFEAGMWFAIGLAYFAGWRKQ